MLIISNLRRQHTEILGLASEINTALLENPPPIEHIGKLLPALAGRISMHLAMEDNALYPKLLDSPEAKIRNTAGEFITRMGDFKKIFGDYHQRWNSNLKVKDSFNKFRRETQMILAALTQRISREDEELYDVADRIPD
jgi:hypothetical protein